MTYIPEAVTPRDDVMIEVFTTSVGRIAAIGQELAIVNLNEPVAATAEVSTDRLPQDAKPGYSLRLSRWTETAEDLKAGRVVTEIRVD